MNMLQYHHSINLEYIVFGEIKANLERSDDEPDFRGAYQWLEREVGFNPLFLAVGTTEEDIRMTGYQNQWLRLISTGPNRRGYRKKGKFPNYVLFSFENIDGVFMDYGYWHLVLNASTRDYQITDYEKRLIFKPSWIKSKWLRKAKDDPHSVQLITPKLYLPNASRIWVRNRQTRKAAELMGFKNVEVTRISISQQ